MTSAIVDSPPRRHIWDLVAEHVEQRSVILGPDARVARVIADMRVRASVRIDAAPFDRPLFELVRAYDKALDIVGHLAAELEAHGATIDDPIDVRAPGSSRLVRVQAMLWDHVRTVVQLRALIEEYAS